MILEVKQLTKRFGELAAVKDVSFGVEEGEVFGIAGPNGAGKTTLFNLIAGTYSGTGEIIFEGQNLEGLRPHQVCRRGVARSFQLPTVFSTMSVYDNVRVGAHFGNASSRGDAAIIREVIDFVGLSGKGDAPVRNLALFNKKLTMLAAALATKPRLLLLDEPIGGLSPAEIDKSVALFKRINQELKITIIVIEHLMRVLVELSHRLMILHNGERIALGLPGEVVREKKVIEVYLGENYA